MEKKIHKKIMNILAKIITYISVVILFLATALIILYILSSQISRQTGKYPIISLYTIVSPSMEPNIKIYDVVLEKRVKNDSELKVGDIITFFSDSLDTNGFTVTHRIKEIIKVNGEVRYITKGDNNQNEDEGYIVLSDIVGKVGIVLPQLGRVQFFISSRIGWTIIILIPALGVIIIDINKLLKIRKVRKQEENTPQSKELEKIREKAENKKLSSLIDRANKLNKK